MLTGASLDFTLGEGAQKLRGCTFFLKKVDDLFSRRTQELQGAHRTLLLERTVLLY